MFTLFLDTDSRFLAFLGNHFLQVLGDNFCCHAVTNPDMASERKLLSQLAPQLSEDMILRLVAAFHDLRRAYESGNLTYPYSLRGLCLYHPSLHCFPDVDVRAAQSRQAHAGIPQ